LVYQEFSMSSSVGLKTINKPFYARASGASKHFQIARSTLWQWVKRPGFPQPLKASSRVTLFDIAAIERYLQAQAAR
jgi:predicted DNA-binding transcriptional regulator AlpA